MIKYYIIFKYQIIKLLPSISFGLSIFKSWIIVGAMSDNFPLFNFISSPPLTNINGTRDFIVRVYDADTGGKKTYEENVLGVKINEGVYSFNFGEKGGAVAKTTESLAIADGSKQVFNYIVKNK
mgnify:CR=1 FL=1